MQISAINNNTTNFQARIKVNKNLIPNLAADLLDTAKSSSHSTASVSASASQVSTLPLDIVNKNSEKVENIEKHIDAAVNHFSAISGRDIKSSAIEDPIDLKDLAKPSAMVSEGACSTASGLGLQSSAVSSVVDHDTLMSVSNSAPQSVADVADSMWQSTYDVLTSTPRARRNMGSSDLALDFSLFSGAGYFPETLGSNAIKEGAEKINKIVKNTDVDIPS